MIRKSLVRKFLLSAGLVTAGLFSGSPLAVAQELQQLQPEAIQQHVELAAHEEVAPSQYERIVLHSQARQEQALKVAGQNQAIFAETQQASVVVESEVALTEFLVEVVETTEAEAPSPEVAEEIVPVETSVSAADLVQAEEPQVAQAPVVTPVQAEAITPHFGVNGEFGGAVSAEVYTEDGLSVVTGRATVTTESGLTADAWHQRVNAQNEQGTYRSSETGAAVSFPLNDYAPNEETGETPRLAVRGHVYGLAHQDKFVNSDASWSGQGASTTVGAQIQARYLIDEAGDHVVEGHLGLEYSQGTSIGAAEPFSVVSPTAYLGYNGQLSPCTSVYVGAGYSQDVYADANIRHNLVCEGNIQVGVGAYAGYRNDRLQAGPEVSLQVGNPNREGLNLSGFARFDVVQQTPSVGVRAQFTF